MRGEASAIPPHGEVGARPEVAHHVAQPRDDREDRVYRALGP